MKKLFATLAASAAFVAVAYAGEAEGVVASVDLDTRTITLEDGTSFVADEGVNVEGVVPGTSVRITYDDTTMNATSVDEV